MMVVSPPPENAGRLTVTAVFTGATIAALGDKLSFSLTAAAPVDSKMGIVIVPPFRPVTETSTVPVTVPTLAKTYKAIRYICLAATAAMVSEFAEPDAMLLLTVCTAVDMAVDTVPLTGCGDGKSLTLTLPDTACVAGKSDTLTVPLTACVAGKLFTPTVPLTGCVAGKLPTLTEPLTGCVTGRLLTLTLPLTGWVAGKLLTVTDRAASSATIFFNRAMTVPLPLVQARSPIEPIVTIAPSTKAPATAVTGPPEPLPPVGTTSVPYISPLKLSVMIVLISSGANTWLTGS